MSYDADYRTQQGKQYMQGLEEVKAQKKSHNRWYLGIAIVFALICIILITIPVELHGDLSIEAIVLMISFGVLFGIGSVLGFLSVEYKYIRD